MIEISCRRMGTFRCEILRINPYLVARSCQRIFDKYAGILMHFRLRDFTVWIPRFADHSTKTRIRTNRKKLFPKEIFIRFHKQNKNLETSSQKMDFNFVFTNREKGNGYKMMDTSVIFLLQIILIYNSQKRRS